MQAREWLLARRKPPPGRSQPTPAVSEAESFIEEPMKLNGANLEHEPATRRRRHSVKILKQEDERLKFTCRQAAALLLLAVATLQIADAMGDHHHHHHYSNGQVIRTAKVSALFSCPQAQPEGKSRIFQLWMIDACWRELCLWQST